MDETAERNPVAYEPKPGDEVLVTIRLTVNRDGDFSTDLMYADAKRDSFLTVPNDRAIVVKVEPAPVDLPSTPFAVIRADLKGGTTDEVLSLSDPMNALGWTDSAGGWYSGDRITRVHEILFPGVPS